MVNSRNTYMNDQIKLYLSHNITYTGYCTELTM